MPPRIKFTKNEIVAAALNLVKREGINGLTARGLGVELGTSSRPIFTAFQNMEEVRREVFQAAKSVYHTYSMKGLAENPPFRGAGMQYFRFAKEEPKLFELLFMKGNGTTNSISDILLLTHDNHEKMIATIQQSYDVSKDNAITIFQTMFLFTHGLACLHVSGRMHFSENEVRERIIDVFKGVLLKIKSESLESGI